MENENKIIQTIKKILELSKNNPSKEEAQAAALKAQELLARYHIDAKEVEDIDLDKVDEITEVKVDVPAKKWKYSLARIIANNFRCKHFYYGKGTVVFYGHSTDATIASETFKSLFSLGNILAGREVDRVFGLTGTSKGVYNSFVAGFCSGVEQALNKQCQALMLVIPEDVQSAYNDMSKSFRRMQNSGLSMGGNTYCVDAYYKGINEGKNAIGRKQIEK